jgi:hypothetical protein
MRPGAQSRRLTTAVSTRAKGLLKLSLLQLRSQNLGTLQKPAKKSGGGAAQTVYASPRMSFPITCTACHKTFTISDEIYEKKVAGRVVTIKCKSCGQGIRIDGSKGAPAAVAPAAAPVAEASVPTPEPTAAPSEPVWAVDYPDGQDREFTTPEVLAELERGAINGTTLVWRDGMAEWLELQQVPELSGELAKIEAKKAAAAKAAAAKAAAAAPVHKPRAPMPTVTGLGGLPGAAKPKAGAAEPKPKLTQPSSPELKPKLTQPSSPELKPKLTQPSSPELKLKLTQPSSPELKPKLTQPSSPGLELAKPRAKQASSPTLPDATPEPTTPAIPAVAPPPPPPIAAPVAPPPALAPPPAAAPPPAPPPPVAAKPPPPALNPFMAEAPVTEPIPPLPASVAKVVSRPPQVPSFPQAMVPQAPVPSPPQAFGTAPVLVTDHASVEWPEAKKKTPLIVAGVIAAVAIIGGVVFLLTNKDELPPPAPSITAAPTPAGRTPVTTPTSASTPLSAPATSQPGAETASGSDPIAAPRDPGVTPGADFAELFAAGARKAESKGATLAPTSRFDPAATKAPLAQAANDAQACKQSGGPSGKVTVVVTFDPNGKASSATITEPPFAGTATGQCISAALKRATIPPFSGLPGTVSKTFSIL